MIIADTSILSTFARIQRLDLLFIVAETKSLHLPPAVQRELRMGLQKGLHFLQPIIDGLAAATQFHSVPLTAEEVLLLQTLPRALNLGEKEGIAICLKRTGAKLLTNDKRAHNFCKANHIPSLDLKLVLRQLWKAGHCTKDEVKSLMNEIEKSEPGMVIKGKEEILR
jgi:predicted nucleic acid-binding protein